MLELGNGADVARMERGNRNLLFALHSIERAELFTLSRIGVIQRRACFKHARVHLEKGKLAYKRVGNGFKHLRAERFAVRAEA